MLICLKNNKKEAYFEEKLQELENVSIRYAYTNDAIDLKGVDVLIASKITKEELESSNQLKVLIFPYTGVNHLPLDLIKEKNITIVNSHAHAPIVALRAVSLGLALLGRVVELHQALKVGSWRGEDNTSTWTSILNMRCGYLGMGAIGQHIVNYIKPFNTKIVTLKRYEKRNLNLENPIYYETIEEVCLNSDIIFISLPLTNETKNIIDQKILSQMQDQYIVNVGRGELINETDLYNALSSKSLKGAALDVWYQYPKDNTTPQFPASLPFQKLNNVVLSPHCSGNSYSTRKLVIDEIIKNLSYYVNNKQVLHEVNVFKEY